MIRLSLIVMVSVLAGCSETSEDKPADVPNVSTAKAFQPVHCTVAIEGMHCQNCANSISLAMNECALVRSVAVSFEKKQATIVAENSAALDCAIHAAIESGYTVGPPQPAEYAQPAGEPAPTSAS